jgi:predicted HTH domain antitoxin
LVPSVRKPPTQLGEEDCGTINIVQAQNSKIRAVKQKMSKEISGEMERVLKIPRDVMEALRLPPDEVETELRKELALALYQRGVLSSGKACALARMTRWEFEEVLGQRQIRRHYTEKNLEEDIEYARSRQ